MKFTVILDPALEGGYTVICPALPGCVSEGNDREEALRNIREAIALWSEVWLETHKKLPAETPAVVAKELEKSLRERADEGLPLTIETTEVDVELSKAGRNEARLISRQLIERADQNREAIYRHTGTVIDVVEMLRRDRDSH
jgi:predicted RNase H-like HicB family nuclease